MATFEVRAGRVRANKIEVNVYAVRLQSFAFPLCAGLKVAADQGITQVGVAAVRVEYSRVIKQFLSFSVRF